MWAADGTPVKVPEAKVRALLAALLVRAGDPVPAGRLAEDLWGGAPPGNPANTLQTKVSQLRRIVGRDAIRHGAAGYHLAIGPAALDAAEFTGLVERARRTPDAAGRAELLGRALDLWRGPAYAEVRDEPFARSAAGRLEEQRLLAYEEWVEARLELGAHAALAGELTAAVAQHPWRERLLAAHLRALAGAGRQREAIETFLAFRGRLADELGVDPSPELESAYRAVLTRESVPTVAPRLPAPLAPLIGRDADRDRVRAALARARLVTLTGPGGVGKTRLALAAAHTGHLVELAGLPRGAPASAVTERLAAVLGLRDETRGRSGDPADRIAAALTGARALVVLDNAEHVVDAAATVVSRLLGAVADLRVLATSREPLGVGGEVVFPVAPLSPDDAAALFETRARAADPGVRADRPAVEVICARLDGIPLAIELAAARVRTLGVTELARRMDDRFAVLGGGPRDAAHRQRTLRAAVDWSWDLLDDDERAMLRRLAVHAGGATLEAAVAVSGPPASLDVLARLVDRSLVVAVTDDVPRYRLLETVAAYATERLAEAGETRLLRRRHVAYYLGLAEQARPHLHGPAQGDWLRRLDAESANLAAALAAATGEGAARLLDAAAWWWFLRGRYREAHRAFAAAPSLGPVPAWRAGFALFTQQDPGPAVAPADGLPAWFLAHAQAAFGDEAAGAALIELVIARTRPGEWLHAAALTTRSTAALFAGDLSRLRKDADEALATFERLGDAWGRLQAADNLAALAQITGDYPEARRLHREAVRAAEALDLTTDAAHHLTGLGRVAMLTGDLAEAEELHQRALALATAHANTYERQFAELGLGLVARRAGRYADARRHLEAWLDWNRAVPGGQGLALLLAELGFVAEQTGNAGEAKTLHAEGLEVARGTGDPRAVALALEGLAGAAALDGDARQAARLLAEAGALRDGVDAPLPPGERADVDRITARIAALRTAGR
ncbi:tetratricopeptide repeat protein [Actinoplanes sp. NEAU-A11]|uniref:Tetratricopeptide repeat protein n=1 Tax=Actinoplanes aureus TaxID=2792083 RepID=A0A931C7C3_9ACTN|nr:tetratricopeptide repeat protein [Actinoplanes aureus]